MESYAEDLDRTVQSADRNKVKDKIDEICGKVGVRWKQRVETILPLGGSLETTHGVSNTATSVTYHIEFFGVEYVHVKASTIQGAGLGLFASRDFKKDETIGIYMGELLLDGREKTVNHLKGLQPKERAMYMGMHYMNDVTFSDDRAGVRNQCQNNAVLRANYLVQATRTIKKGREIFAQYN